jgi:hypothetical protein
MLKALLFFISPKSRLKFYVSKERRSFRTASTKTGREQLQLQQTPVPEANAGRQTGCAYTIAQITSKSNRPSLDDARQWAATGARPRDAPLRFHNCVAC